METIHRLGAKRAVRTILGAFAVFSLSSATDASIGRIATLDERIVGAHSVVVATTRSITPQWRENIHGDRLIVSQIELEIEETLKGPGSQALWLEMEGGTLDGLTLQVSSLPLIEQPGERAVFFLDSVARGVYTPHLRGQGILFLEEGDVVRGTSLHLSDIRSRARALAAGQ